MSEREGPYDFRDHITDIINDANETLGCLVQLSHIHNSLALSFAFQLPDNLAHPDVIASLDIALMAVQQARREVERELKRSQLDLLKWCTAEAEWSLHNG